MRPGSRMAAALVVVAIGAYGWPVEAREDDGDVPVPRVIGTRPKPVDVPGKRPFVGPPGEDPFGYPVRTADRVALSQLLRLRRFNELDRYLSEYQADFERDPKKEYWAIDAFDSFDTEDPEVGLALDQWIEARPSSWTARMARGTYRLRLAWFQRGNKTAAKTNRARFRAMDETLRSAHPDLLKALEAKPTLVAAQRKLIIMGRLGSQYRAEEPQVLAAALKSCPACFQVRVAFMFGLVPRWGGTYVAMTDFARETQKQAELNPRLRVLEGYVDHDRCNEAMLDKEWNKAGKICRRLARYEHWELDLELAKVLLHEKKHEEAIVLLDRALLQRPQDDELLRYRMYVLDGLERWEDLGRTALTLRRLNVADERIAKMAANATDRLVYEAYRLGQSKDLKRARALLDLTLAIDPEHR